ncbi:MAG: TRAP transporter small permease, partial [Heliobacteriaceae bacterium]|nr:TRAP transporter small permease [Heliobacteriaceae bacterium]
YRLLGQINQRLLQLSGWLVVAGMVVIAVVIPYEVFGRHVLGVMPAWSGELATFTLVWVSMLGAAVGLPRGYQIGMTFFLDQLPRKAGRLVQAFGLLLSMAILSVLVIYGCKQTLANVSQTSAAMGISMAIPYFAVPLGAFLMLLVSIEQVLGLFLGNEKPSLPDEKR